MPGLQRTFEKQIQHLSLRIEKLQGVNKQFSHIRLIHVLLGIPLVWAGFQFAGNWAGRIVTVAVVAAFLIVLYRHGRLKDSINRHRILLDLKSTQVARMRLDWERIPRVSAMPVEAGHPFGIDLDIMGERSVHRLIDTTVSIEGSRKVWSWLMAAEPDLDGILKRQKLVKELGPLALFRDKLIVNVLKARKLRTIDWRQKAFSNGFKSPAPAYRREGLFSRSLLSRDVTCSSSALAFQSRGCCPGTFTPCSFSISRRFCSSRSKSGRHFGMQ